MDVLIVCLALVAVIILYFRNNPLHHSRKFMIRRFVNWFPLGMTYAFLYMGRYNLNVAKNALGTLMSKEDFGIIFGVGTIVYGLSFLINGPLVDKLGGKKGMLAASLGACIANAMMGVVTYWVLTGQWTINAVLTYSVLYGLNMFFQSYGAVSIIKVKAYWFHVRERGIFGAIFGTLISVGIYFAFDWGPAVADAAKMVPNKPLGFFQQIIRSVFAVDTGSKDAVWLVFFVPSILLAAWFVIDALILKDTPGEAGFEDFDTHDASSGEMDKDFTIGQLLHRIFTHPVLLTVSMIEFTCGVIRNGILQWYFIFFNEVPQPGAEFFRDHWGLLLCLTGIFGGFLSGWLSDYVFQSRRGPPAALMNGSMFFLTIIMAITLMYSPITVGTCAVLISLAAIGVHSIMSGTAAADFGGRKATATASGITDGFVYLGTGLQSLCLGFLTEKSWQFWPVFLIPFTVIGFFLAMRIWKAIPEATKRYLKTVENIKIAAELESVGADAKITIHVQETIETTQH